MERFTIRVYGLLIHHERILVSDEIIKGRRITKFPGGGLEFGEGLKDALIREIHEELNVDVVDLEHFYTTDFFQQSTFHQDPMQVVSVYYKFNISAPDQLPVAEVPFGHGQEGAAEVFRWIPLNAALIEDMSLPIDRHVLDLLLQQWRSGELSERT